MGKLTLIFGMTFVHEGQVSACLHSITCPRLMQAAETPSAHHEVAPPLKTNSDCLQRVTTKKSHLQNVTYGVALPPSALSLCCECYRGNFEEEEEEEEEEAEQEER